MAQTRIRLKAAREVAGLPVARVITFEILSKNFVDFDGFVEGDGLFLFSFIFLFEVYPKLMFIFFLIFSLVPFPLESDQRYHHTFLCHQAGQGIFGGYFPHITL